MRTHFLIAGIISSLFAALAFTFADGDRWQAPEEAKKLKNPLQPISSIISDGRYLFRQNCKACHGSLGKGDGPVAVTLQKKVADLSSVSVQQQTYGELYYKISIGRVEMPSFKGILESQERWALVHYIRTLGEMPSSDGGS